MNGQLIKRVAMLNGFFRVADAGIIIMAAYAAYALRFSSLNLPSSYLLFSLALLFLTTNVFTLYSIYGASRGERMASELTRVSLAWLTVIFAIAALTFATRTGQEYSRIWAGYMFAISYISLISYRLVVRMLIHKLLSNGFNQRYVVIVGAGKLGERACKAMQEESWAGLTPIAFFDDLESLKGSTLRNVEIKGSLKEAASFIEGQRKLGETPIDQVWITLPLSSQAAIENLQLTLQDTATKVYFVPDVYGFNLASYEVGEIAGLPVMNMSAPPISSVTEGLKRFEDVTISAFLLIILSPVLLVCAFLIKRESPGPVFFKQRRYGMQGEEILVWKFRSMTVTEDGDIVKQASRNDNRVTKIGKFLRQSSLDELPQLINVLQGKMSLVGPRPHAVAHNEFYRTKVQGYMIRHQIRPGITGWAQVNGCRGETSEITDMEERVRFDLEYIRKCSIAMDIRILFMTISTVLNNKDTY